MSLSKQTENELSDKNPSTGTVEYTDYFSAVGKVPAPTNVLDMTLNNLMGRFQ